LPAFCQAHPSAKESTMAGPTGGKSSVGAPKPAPGDEAAPGTPGAGEDVCPECGGSGRIENRPCPVCEGTGRIVAAIGGG
jgi:hypothetical protein